ncbi:MAG: hypothetical protein E7011_01205 [Alphaproteobacteria bacterium]|nr:hypothetical protein [Alphaproteobacteria bacterium]
MQQKIQTYMGHQSHPDMVQFAPYALGGAISFDTAINLIKTLNAHPFPSDFCWGYMVTDFSATTYNYDKHRKNFKTMKSFLNFCKSSPYINSQLSLCIHSDFTTPVKCKCTTQTPDSALQKLMLCHKTLATGKCRDEFMCKTVGATLFPQYYGKQKVK